jgi:hypothetical protein
MDTEQGCDDTPRTRHPTPRSAARDRATEPRALRRPASVDERFRDLDD